MALDTAAKRLSAVAIGSPWRPVVPVPDGTLDQGDRQTFARLARAVLATSAVALVAARSRSATIPREPRSLTVPRARRSFDA